MDRGFSLEHFFYLCFRQEINVCTQCVICIAYVHAEQKIEAAAALAQHSKPLGSREYKSMVKQEQRRLVPSYCVPLRAALCISLLAYRRLFDLQPCCQLPLCALRSLSRPLQPLLLLLFLLQQQERVRADSSFPSPWAPLQGLRWGRGPVVNILRPDA